MPAISILRTVREAFGFTNRQIATWISVASIPLLLNAVVIGGVYIASDGQRGSVFAEFVRNLLTLAIDVPFLAAWHRMTLLGPDNARGVIGYAYRGAERRYLGFLMLAYLFFLVGSMVGSVLIVPLAMTGGEGPGTILIAVVLSIALTVMLAYVLLRWSMAFPAISVGERLGFTGSWQLTSGHGGRIFLTLMTVFLPMFAIAAAVVSIVGLRSVLGPGYVVVELMMLIPGFYFAAVAVSALSMIYWHLTGYDPSTFRVEAIMKR